MALEGRIDKLRDEVATLTARLDALLATAERVKSAIDRDGGLSLNGADFIGWFPGQPEVTLDGDFTAAELRAIADHMEAHRKTATEG